MWGSLKKGRAMLRKLSYRSRFIMNFIILVWLPMILMGGIIFYVIHVRSENQIKEEYNQVLAHTREHLLDTFFMPVEMLTGIEEVFSVDFKDSSALSTALLSRTKTIFPYLNRLYILNDNGSYQLNDKTGSLEAVAIERMSINSKKMLVESAFEKGKVVWGTPTIGEDQQSIELGVTIGYGDGLIYCAYDLADINKHLSYHPQSGVDISVVGNKGLYILDDDISKVLQLMQIKQFAQLVATGYREEGTTRIYVDKVENMPWYIVTQIDEALFIDGFQGIKGVLLGLIIMILGISGVFAYREIKYNERYAKELLEIILQGLKGKGETIDRDYVKLEREGLNEPLDNMRHFIRDKDQQIERLTDKLQDFMLEIERYQLEVAKEKKHVEEAKASRVEFLGIMGHEIRTPLNSIIGFMQLLRYTECNKQQREYIENVMASSHSVKSIVNDIMDYTLIEVGQLKLHYQETDFKKLLSDVLAVYSSIAKEKDVEFLVELKEPLPLHVVTDPQKLRQVLEHLLSNSFKFTRKGYVKIRVYGNKLNNQEWSIHIQVIDTGIGIEQQLIPRLFEPFARGNTTIQKLYGGNGLGLSITKEIVNLMHGHIEVASEPDVETTFHVEVIMQGVSTALRTSIDKQRNGAIPKREMEILLVEDHLINQQVFVNTLKLEHLSCDVAASGIEAIECCQEKQYDIIFMDLQMPQMDGYEATRRIRRDVDGYESIPIIALTAHTLDEDKRKAREAGMTEYITKPVDIEKIIQMVRNYYKEKPEPSFAAPKKKEIAQDPLANHSWHTKTVRKFMEKTELDLETSQDIIHTYTQEVESCLIEFEHEWMGGNDRMILNRILYKLSGASYSVYAQDVIEDIEWIESHLEEDRRGVNLRVRRLKERIGL